MKKRYAVFVSPTDDYFTLADDDQIVMNKFYLVLVLLAAVAVLAAPAAAEVTLGGSVGGSTATISVTSSPSGAEVYDAGTAQVYASLGPSVTYGYINIHSTPSGANVYVDGTYRDNTPEVISVTAGTAHEVQIVYSGYEVYRQTVTVSTGSTVYLDANLVTSSDAYLKIASSPSGAAVYVDGSYCGNTGYSSGSSMNYMSIGPLTAGTHAVMLKLDGYNTYTTTVTLSPNEIRTMSVTLTQSSPTPSSGNTGFHIASTPSGAEVYVDNAFRGYTPVYLSDISEGRHTVLLKHTGYNDWTEYVVFTAGQTVEKDVTMSPASVPPAPTQSPFPVLAFAGLAAAAVFAIRRMY